MHRIRKRIGPLVVVAVALVGATIVVTVKSRGAEASAQGCTRSTLQAAAARYYTALVAHDATKVTWAPDVKVTENGTAVMPGEGIWQTAAKATFTRVSYDTAKCGVHSFA